LHVLSLSLAFILSQDQTLRCCLSCFSFFQNLNKARIFVIIAFARQLTLSHVPMGLPAGCALLIEQN
ncbi:MAG: hypothetical protein K2K22_09465, partial [Muribaculaceae bacterium]|nr:hypothetical protein [Muribaculaceae bacterium]